MFNIGDKVKTNHQSYDGLRSEGIITALLGTDYEVTFTSGYRWGVVSGDITGRKIRFRGINLKAA